MPSLPLYLAQDDLALISAWLSADEDIALITAIGPSTWKAVLQFQINSSGRYCLYHKRCGDLPLPTNNKHDADKVILNPFEGWEEQRSGANPHLPYFGAGTPSVFWFNVRLEESGVIGLSSFEWVGNHYSIIWKRCARISEKMVEQTQKVDKKK